jgi:hypothetical protein
MTKIKPKHELPTDAIAIAKGCIRDDFEARQIRTFAKKYCGVDLLDWQYDNVVNAIWGWRRPDNKLRYRYAHLWCPKKSGVLSL